MAISRRQFAQLAGSSVATTTALLPQQRNAPARPITAQQIVDRLRTIPGSSWNADSLDGFKAGEPSTEVTGIATTAMATMDVLSRAVSQKANLIFTLEPVFFGRTDGQGVPASPQGGRGPGMIGPDDPILLAKKEFIQKNGLVVFRLSDNWRNHAPDPFSTGLAQTMGWTKHQVGNNPLRYDIPAITIEELARTLATRFRARAGIRVVGDRQTHVSRIALSPGLSPVATILKTLPDSDLVITGETREWEAVEYAQDAVSSGQKKGLIMLGRVLSEQPAMAVCAEWLKTLIPETSVRSLPTGDPYWRPA